MLGYITIVKPSHCSSLVKKKILEISQGMGQQDIVGGLLVMNKYAQFKVQGKEKPEKGTYSSANVNVGLKKRRTHNKTVYIFLSEGIH